MSFHMKGRLAGIVRRDRNQILMNNRVRLITYVDRLSGGGLSEVAVL